MNAQKRIIAALDVSTRDEAALLVEELVPYVGCFKIGLELMTAIGGPQAVELIHSLSGNVFYDGKFKDIPNTVAQASRAVAQQGVAMFNIHCLAGSEAMRKTREAVDTAISVDETIMLPRKVLTSPLILGVTILTSLNYNDLVELGIFKELNIANPEERAHIERETMENLVVRHLARLAQENGLDGVVASPKEIKSIREYCGPDFKIVTPGIRPLWANVDDQKRFTTPAEAIFAGADYLVIGRPITKPPKNIGSPANAANLFLEEVSGALEKLEKGGSQ